MITTPTTEEGITLLLPQGSQGNASVAVYFKVVNKAVLDGGVCA